MKILNDRWTWTNLNFLFSFLHFFELQTKRGNELLSVNELVLLLQRSTAYWVLFGVMYLASVPVYLWRLLVNDVLDREKLELDVRSRLLFTYRKGFKTIGESCDVTSDECWQQFIYFDYSWSIYMLMVLSTFIICSQAISTFLYHKVAMSLIAFTHCSCEWVEPVTGRRHPRATTLHLAQEHFRWPVFLWLGGSGGKRCSAKSIFLEAVGFVYCCALIVLHADIGLDWIIIIITIIIIMHPFL